MFLMFTDETNTQPSPDSKFFVYGGLILRVDLIPELDATFADIRKRAGFSDGDEFKFDSRSRPKSVTQQKHAEAKREVIDLCNKLDAKFIVHIILHDIIRNQDLENQVRWAADYVIGKFNEFLIKNDDNGLCIVDRLPIKNDYRYLTDKFTQGLKLDSGTKIKLNRIKLFASSSINASHISSAMDIVLGSFRYCINHPKNPDAAKQMIGRVSDLLWGEKKNGNYYVIGSGVIVRPKMNRITVESYKKEYEDLFAHINSLLDD